MKEPKKEASRAHARPPAQVNEALALPVADRATLAIQQPWEAQRLQPQEWPEVRKIAAAFASAVGRERKLSEFSRDSGLRAIVALLAAGNTVDDVAWVAGNVPKQAWWRSDGRTRGLASLSPEVVARALDERDGGRRAVVRVRTCARPETSEEWRLRRNVLLQNAEAGRYGADVRRRAESGVDLRELADELERREALGAASVTRAAAHESGGNGGAQQRARGVVKSSPARNASRCLAELMGRLAADSDASQVASGPEMRRSRG